MKFIVKCLLIFGFFLTLIQSCVLEERYHVNNDLSGIYEVSFSMKTDGEESEEKDVEEEDKSKFEELIVKINDTDGVDVVSSSLSETGFDISLKFKNLKSINSVNETTADEKTPAIFSLKDNKLFFIMNLPQDPEKDSKINSEKWLTHRVIVTFEDKMRRVRSDGFKKIDKKTLIYDSSKSNGNSEISFSIKLKK